MSIITVAEAKTLAKAIKLHVQCDDYEIRLTDEGLLYSFPILGSDPEEVFEDFGIYQESGKNIINLDQLKRKMATDESLRAVICP
jgi:hypothetical protein